MERQEALTAVEEQIKNRNLIKHMLATEAIMRSLARCLGQDVELWGLTGLLHDIDMEHCGGDMHVHSRMGAEMVREMGADEAVVNAILRHNEAHGVPVESELDRALYCADALTGLITTTALVRPDRKLSSVELKSIKKKYREKGFAAGVSREQIETCASLGFELDRFIELGLNAMKEIAPELGL